MGDGHADLGTAEAAVTEVEVPRPARRVRRPRVRLSRRRSWPDTLARRVGLAPDDEDGAAAGA